MLAVGAPSWGPRAGALALTTLLFALPGLGASLALYRPGRVPLALRLALVPVLGVAIVGASALVLAVAGILAPVPFLVLVAAATAGAWWVALRRGGLRSHVRAVRQELVADPWAIGLGLVVLAGFAILRLSWDPALHATSPTPWRYWADAIEIADAGHVPETTLQYGMRIPPTVNKVFLNAVNAGVSFVAAREPLAALGALLWLGAVGTALSLWALARELGLRWAAALLPLVLLVGRRFGNPELATDLDTYKAEIFGRMIAFAAVAVGVRALRTSARRDAVVAGGLLGVAAVIHAVPVLIALTLFGVYSLVLLATGPRRREALVLAAVTGVVAVAVAGAVVLASGGDLGLGGAASDAAYERFGPGFDPTLFVNAGVAPEDQVAAAGRWRVPPLRSLRRYVGEAVGGGEPAGAGVSLAASVAALLLAAALARWGPRRLRPTGIAAWGLAAAIVLLTTMLSYRSELFIPANFGIRRLFDYGLLPVVLIAAGAIEWGLDALGRRRRAFAAVALVALLAGVGAATLPRALPAEERVARSRQVVSALQTVASAVPCDARVLANLHTEGVFQAGLGRVAVLEGMTPYLRPAILETVVRRFLEARAFFRDPAANERFVRELDVDHVVVFRGGGPGYPAMIGGADLAALDAAPFLERVAAAERATVYRVRGGGGVALPSGLGAPGYDCARPG